MKSIFTCLLMIILLQACQSTFLTRDEILQAIETKKAEDAAEKMKVLEAEKEVTLKKMHDLEKKLIDYCATHAKDVEAIREDLEGQMLMTFGEKRVYDVNHIPFAVGFCAMASLSNQSFSVTYNDQHHFIRVILGHLPVVKKSFAALIMDDVSLDHIHEYRNDSERIVYGTIQFFFEEMERRKETCKWRPC